MISDIFIPARLASFRLAQKHLKLLKGKPVIGHLIDRLKLSKKFRNIIVCTTNLASDDPLVDYLDKENIMYYRGNNKDILSRFLGAAKCYNTEIIIDVEGDKIYTDPFFVDKIVSEMENSDVDFVIGNDSIGNFDPTLELHGFIPTGIRVSALEKICKLKSTNDTETGYKEFFTSNDIIKKKYIFLDTNLKIPKNMRLTLDYKEDFELAEKIFDELGNKFNYQDVLNLFSKRPELLKITESLIKKWESEYKENVTDYKL